MASKSGMKVGVTIALLVAGAVAIWYFFIRKTATVAAATNGAVSNRDSQVVAQMLSVFQEGYGVPMPGWLINIADEYMDGRRLIGSDGQLVDGKMTKASAILAAYATSYWRNGYEGRTVEQEDAINKKMYAPLETWSAEEKANRYR